MPWPSATDFSDAIQNPAICFRGNNELSNCQVSVYPAGGRAGMPVVATGQFACVYKVSSGVGDIAVRCFTREVKDHQERYGWLGQFLNAVLPPSFVQFQYLEQGILVKGQWYPVVQMEWASGEPLNLFIRNHLGNSNAIAGVAARWRGAMGSLRGLGIAHNDLQHGNILVQPNGDVRLVDYDGIFLPRFQGQSSPELGHKNYQHPQRSTANYSADIDNFPALVLYLSLRGLQADFSLWDRFYNDDNLLLTQKDYASPRESQCLQALKQSPDEMVKKLASKLEEYCSLPVEQVPDLESILGEIPVSIVAPSATPISGMPPASGGYRDLLQSQQQSSGQQPPVAPVRPALANKLVRCSRCGRNNDQGLIYCVNPACIAPLSTSVKVCICRASIPANARYCTQCGQLQNQVNPPIPPATPQQPSTLTHPAASAQSHAQKACPNCRLRLPGSAIYCNRCGTVLI